MLRGGLQLLTTESNGDLPALSGDEGKALGEDRRGDADELLVRERARDQVADVVRLQRDQHLPDGQVGRLRGDDPVVQSSRLRERLGVAAEDGDRPVGEVPVDGEADQLEELARLLLVDVGVVGGHGGIE